MALNVMPPTFDWDPVNIREFYNQAEAAAGTSLQIPELGIVLCSAQALDALPSVLNRLDATGTAPVLVVQDATPMRRGGDDLKPFVESLISAAGHPVSVLTLGTSADQKLVTNQTAIEQVKSDLHDNQVVIALGSGCITDIVKHACFEIDQTTGRNTPLIAIQTANSVCAFTSRMAVLTINGVKRTVPSRMADALIMDTQILKDAPAIFRTGGLGDVAVGAVTFADLQLADALGMGAWNQLAYDTSSDIRNILLAGDNSIADGDYVGQEVAGKLLTLAGLSLTLCGDSAPLSGYEHVTSHMLDMAAKANGRPVANHGHQCALATVLSLLLYRHVIEQIDAGALDLEQCYPANDTMRAKINQVFGSIDPSGAAAKECAGDYQQKLEKWRKKRGGFERFLVNWNTGKAKLQEHLMAPEEYVKLLHQIGHPLRFEDMETPLTRNEVRWAFQNAHLMRKRFTIGDLAYLGGMFDDAVCDKIFLQFDELTKSVSGNSAI